MADQTTAELIAEARRLARHSSVSVPEHANMLERLADALEDADQRAAELAAVVEEALSHDPLHGADSGLHCGGMAPCIRDILATAPTDALREVRADAWDEALTTLRNHGWLEDGDDLYDLNPYRKEQS